MSLKKVNQPSTKLTQGRDKNQLMELIQKQRQFLKKIENRISEWDNKIKKVSQSNVRNISRKQRHLARLQSLKKCKAHPQLLLAFSGIMNQYVQAFMISHNFQMNEDITNMNPDHMSYEQLLQLGQKIGKVSKGLNKQDIEKLDHIKIQKNDEPCPICRIQFQFNEIVIGLRCKHIYHEQCIIEWLKDQNRCPICKQYVLKSQEQ